MSTGSTDTTIALAGFTFDTALLELRDATGTPVELRAQALAVLRCLARQQQHVVPRDDLMRAVWPASSSPTAASRNASPKYLVLVGCCARGGLRRGAASISVQHLDAYCRLVEEGWAQDNAAFRQIMTSQMYPGASAEEMHSFTEMQRVACTPQEAANIRRLVADYDASEHLHQVRCPTVPAAGAPALAPHWGSVKPWGLDVGSQFRPEPPPRIDSDAPSGATTWKARRSGARAARLGPRSRRNWPASGRLRVSCCGVRSYPNL